MRAIRRVTFDGLFEKFADVQRPVKVMPTTRFFQLYQQFGFLIHDQTLASTFKAKVLQKCQ